MPIRKFLELFSSLRLTVLLLVLLMILVLAGTLGQVSMGLYRVQAEFFRSFFILWGPPGGRLRIPIFPGGYLIGSFLLLNLVAAHLGRFKPAWKELGIWLIHGGLIVLLGGQALSGIFARESVLHLRVGESSTYSVSQRRAELAILGPDSREGRALLSLPQSRLREGAEFADPRLPFTIRVERWYSNSSLSPLPASEGRGAAEAGAGAGLLVKEAPPVSALDRADLPSALLRLRYVDGREETWLVSEGIAEVQDLGAGGKGYGLALRPERYYADYSLGLLSFHHEVYPGSSIPKDYSSRLLLSNPATGERREVLIEMNRPLRYGGMTYYQAGFDTDARGTVLQVVRNPAWLGPYLSVSLVSLGLLIQFGSQLLRSLRGGRAR